MRRLRRGIALLLLCGWVLGLCPVRAASDEPVFPSVFEQLPEEAKALLEENGVDSDTEVQEALDLSVLWKRLSDDFITGWKEPLRDMVPLLLTVLMCAGCAVFSETAGATVQQVGILGISLSLVSQTMNSMTTITALLKTVSGLTTALIPVLAGVLAASGRGLTAVGLGGALLTAADGVTLMAAYWVMPLLSGMIAMGLCGSVWGHSSAAALSKTVKKGALGGLTLTTTVFSAVLGLKGVLYAGADTVGVKTAQFILKGVPVAGSALSGSLTAVLATLSAVRHTVWAYGVIALTAAVAPALIRLGRRWICLAVIRAVCRWFSLPAMEENTGILQDAFTVMMALVLLCYGMFLVGLGVVAAV